MDEDISVATDRRSEMGVLCHSQSIMTHVSRIYRRHAEVDGLVHCPRCHDSHQLVEEGVLGALGVIQTVSELLRSFSGHFESELS